MRYSLPGRPVLFGLIAFAFLLFSGCSVMSGGDPREQANADISKANSYIVKHNELFNSARTTYGQAKQAVASGSDPSKEVPNISKAKTDLDEARKNLDKAKAQLAEVQKLEVDPAIKEYATLLTQALDAQLNAEGKEVEFYGLLQSDPTLSKNRDQALKLLGEIGPAYDQARAQYDKAQKFADAHSSLIASGPTTQPATQPTTQKTVK